MGMFAKCNVQLGEELTTCYQCEMNHTIELTKCYYMSKKFRGNVESSLKNNVTSNPKICNRQTKDPSKKKAPVCTETFLRDKIKTVPYVFALLVEAILEVSAVEVSFSVVTAVA